MIVKRFLGFSSMEWTVLALGACAVFSFRWAQPDMWWRLYIGCFSLGFLFEASMGPLYTYNNKLKERHCVDGSDVNFLFPFGWLSIAGLSMVIALKLLGTNTLVAYIAATLISGNLHEFFFYKFKYWTYNYDASFIGNYKPFHPKITIAGVPVQVIAGYANVGIMLYLITHYLFIS